MRALDGIVFALCLMAAFCAECLPLAAALVLGAAAVQAGGKIANVWDFGIKKPSRVVETQGRQADKTVTKTI